MVQTSLILLLIVVILLFLFTVKLHFVISDVIEKIEEIEIKLIKVESDISTLEDKEAYLESNLRMALNELKSLTKSIGGKE